MPHLRLKQVANMHVCIEALRVDRVDGRRNEWSDDVPRSRLPNHFRIGGISEKWSGILAPLSIPGVNSNFYLSSRVATGFQQTGTGFDSRFRQQKDQ